MRTCSICGELIENPQSNNQKYHWPECHKEYVRREKREYYARHKRINAKPSSSGGYRILQPGCSTWDPVTEEWYIRHSAELPEGTLVEAR